MPNKSIDLLQHPYAVVMVSDDNEHYQHLNGKSEDMSDEEDYEPVVVNEQDDGNFDDYETSDVVQEIYDADINIEQSNTIWRYSSIRYLIYCWSQLREQFLKCPDNKKKALWQNVSEQMFERGFYFDAQACENKWRGLKKVYMYNKTRTTRKDGTKHIIVWAHYSDMDKAMNGIPYELSGFADVDEDLHEAISPLRVNSSNVRDDVDKLNWTADASKELIRLYGKERKRFSAVNQGSKHLLWEEIAQQLSELGHHYSSNSCNDKWRNLKMSYKKNKQRAMKYGEQNVKWFYFKDIDNILQNASQESASQQSNIITVSLNDTNELVDLKKEKIDYDDDSDFQTSSITVMENDDQNESIGSNDNIDGDEIITPLGSSSEVWTEEATKCLIEMWGLYRPRFLLAPQGKKRILWTEISEQLRQRGFNYSGTVCDRKWRLLKANYFKRKEKYKKLGMGGVKWQYYYDLDRLLGVPVETISWSMDSTMCLIDCFYHHKEKFMKAATGEKLSIWKEISEEMLQNGFMYSPRACDNKWRTLKNRYNKNRMRVNRNKKVIWVYYDKIDSVLRDDKTSKTNTQNDDMSDQTHENNDLYEHNYIRTLKPDSSIKTEIVAELKEMFRLRNAEFDQWSKKIDEDLKNREKVFEDLQRQVLDALNRSNELEAHKLKLLENLVSRLPQTL